MKCRNCGRELPAETGAIDLPGTTLRVCSACWTWTEDVIGTDSARQQH